VGSQLAAPCVAFCAASGDAAATPIDKAAAILFIKTLIKDLPDL